MSVYNVTSKGNLHYIASAPLRHFYAHLASLFLLITCKCKHSRDPNEREFYEFQNDYLWSLSWINCNNSVSWKSCSLYVSEVDDMKIMRNCYICIRTTICLTMWLLTGALELVSLTTSGTSKFQGYEYIFTSWSKVNNMYWLSWLMPLDCKLCFINRHSSL